jgi:hypothetical protein
MVIFLSQTESTPKQLIIYICSDSWVLFVKKQTVPHHNACYRMLDFGDAQERKGGLWREEGGQAAAV